MAEVVMIGGFASTEKQVAGTAEQLAEYLDKDVEALNFRQAREKSSAFFDGRSVITHSGGILPVEGSRPEELLAVAPVVPSSQAALLFKGWAMGRKLHQAEASEERLRDTSYYEGLRHWNANFGALPEISKFNTFEAVRKMARYGTKVTVSLMEQDGLFAYRGEELLEDIEHAMLAHVKVVSVPGEHVRFTNDPASVMAEIAAAEQIVIPGYNDFASRVARLREQRVTVPRVVW